jgi:hypothetical protein
MIRLSVLIVTLLLSFNAQAVNSDAKVDDCVDVSSSDNDSTITFVNNCNRDIFVLYCGDFPTVVGSPKCKAEANTVPINATFPDHRHYFYLTGANLGPSRSFIQTNVRGDFHYALCDGELSNMRATGVGAWIGKNNGEYTEDGNGGVSCSKKHFSKH